MLLAFMTPRLALHYRIRHIFFFLFQSFLNKKSKRSMEPDPYHRHQQSLKMYGNVVKSDWTSCTNDIKSMICYSSWRSLFPGSAIWGMSGTDLPLETTTNNISDFSSFLFVLGKSLVYFLKALSRSSLPKSLSLGTMQIIDFL